MTEKLPLVAQYCVLSDAREMPFSDSNFWVKISTNTLLHPVLFSKLVSIVIEFF